MAQAESGGRHPRGQISALGAVVDDDEIHVRTLRGKTQQGGDVVIKTRARIFRGYDDPEARNFGIV
jgi:hypothetical protein